MDYQRLIYLVRKESCNSSLNQLEALNDIHMAQDYYIFKIV